MSNFQTKTNQYVQMVILLLALCLTTSLSAKPEAKLIREFGLGLSKKIDHCSNPERPLLAIACVKGIYFWNLNTGELLRHLETPERRFSTITFSPDGSQLFTASMPSVYDYKSIAELWDTETGELIRTFQGNTNIINLADFSPDGSKIVVNGEQGEAFIWDTDTGRITQKLPNLMGKATALLFSPEGNKVLTADTTLKVKLWRVNNGQLIQTFPGHTKTIGTLAFSPDGTRIFTSTYDKTLKVWNRSNGQEIRTFTPDKDITFPHAIKVSPDGESVIYMAKRNKGKKNLIHQNISTGEIIQTFPDYFYYYYDFTSDGKSLICSNVFQTRMLDLETSELSYILDAYHVFSSMSFSPDSSKILLTNGSVHIEDTTTGIREIELDTGNLHIWNSFYTPDSQYIITNHFNETNTVTYWDPSTGEKIKTIPAPAFSSKVRTFSTNQNKVFTCDSIDTATLWDYTTGETIQTFTGHTNNIRSMDLSPDGILALTGSEDYTAKLWDTSNGESLHTFNHGGEVILVSFLNEGTEALTVGLDHVINIWNTRTGQLKKSFSIKETENVSFEAAISPNKQEVYLVKSNGESEIFNLQSKQFIEGSVSHSGVRHIIYSPDGTKLLTSAGHGLSKVWDLTPQE